MPKDDKDVPQVEFTAAPAEPDEDVYTEDLSDQQESGTRAWGPEDPRRSVERRISR